MIGDPGRGFDREVRAGLGVATGVGRDLALADAFAVWEVARDGAQLQLRHGARQGGVLVESLEGHEPDDDPRRENAGVACVERLHKVGRDEPPEQREGIGREIILIERSHHGTEPLVQIMVRGTRYLVRQPLDKPSKGHCA